jgi:hypothetical protein
MRLLIPIAEDHQYLGVVDIVSVVLARRPHAAEHSAVHRQTRRAVGGRQLDVRQVGAHSFNVLEGRHVSSVRVVT